jgi:hypothetical protein
LKVSQKLSYNAKINEGVLRHELNTMRYKRMTDDSEKLIRDIQDYYGVGPNYLSLEL